VVALLDLLASPQHSPSRSVADVKPCLRAERDPNFASSLPRAIELVYLQGRTVAAAAQEMGRTQRAVHGLCRRGTRLLAQRLGASALI
jgi:hypothetical protein